MPSQSLDFIILKNEYFGLSSNLLIKNCLQFIRRTFNLEFFFELHDKLK